jgi:DNA polymerase III sliding clamp (beta) subunit (PCNA family)
LILKATNLELSIEIEIPCRVTEVGMIAVPANTLLQSIQYNTDKKTIINKYFNYVIRYKSELITKQFLTIIENIMHSTEDNIEHIMNYFSYHLNNYYRGETFL